MTGDATLTSDTLQALHDSGALTVDDLQRLFAWSRSTAYRRLAGDVAVTLDEAAIICRNCSTDVALALCGVLTGGAAIDHVAIDIDADLDGDGDVDTDDLMLSAAATGGACADEPRSIVDSRSDGRIDHAEAESILERCAAIRQAALTTERIVGLLRRPARKRCRPLKAAPAPAPGSNGRARQ